MATIPSGGGFFIGGAGTGVSRPGGQLPPPPPSAAPVGDGVNIDFSAAGAQAPPSPPPPGPAATPSVAPPPPPPPQAAPDALGSAVQTENASGGPKVTVGNKGVLLMGMDQPYPTSFSELMQRDKENAQAIYGEVKAAGAKLSQTMQEQMEKWGMGGAASSAKEKLGEVSDSIRPALAEQSKKMRQLWSKIIGG